MSTVMDQGMQVSPEAKNGPESEVSGLPKGPIKDNNLNSPLQVGARKKLFTHESKSARKIQPPSTDNVMLVCHSAIDDDPAKSAALAVEKICQGGRESGSGARGMARRFGIGRPRPGLRADGSAGAQTA